MITLRITVTGLFLIAFAMNMIGVAQEEKVSPDELVDDIGEYNGSMGPDNVFYGLKLAFERLDESFTFNETEKLDKMVLHSKLRISEAKTELNKKNDEGAKKAFENYKEKTKETEGSISEIKGNDSGIIDAQKMVKLQQYVLERLLESHPNNTGLKSAYNNSVELEDKFEEKTQKRLESIQTNEGKHYLTDVENGLELNARIIDNKTQVEIKLNIVSDKTDNLSIADEILNELRLSKDNISGILKIEDLENSELKTILEAQAKIGLNVSSINVDIMFALDSTNRTEIIDGIHNKLSNLTKTEILDVLEIKTVQDNKDINQEEPEDHNARQFGNDKREN